MKQRLSSIFISLAFVIGLLSPFAVASDAEAINVFQGCRGSGSTEVCKGRGDSINDLTRTIISVLLMVVGTIAVIMIIIGGIRYVTANGEASNIKSAKDTVLYSIVGLVVALVAYAVVNFVLGEF